jgi:hypothetical protein
MGQSDGCGGGDRVGGGEEVLHLLAGTVDSQTAMLLLLDEWDGDESEARLVLAVD